MKNFYLRFDVVPSSGTWIVPNKQYFKYKGGVYGAIFDASLFWKCHYAKTYLEIMNISKLLQTLIAPLSDAVMSLERNNSDDDDTEEEEEAYQSEEAYLLRFFGQYMNGTIKLSQ